jgi:hypothetical protein
MENTLGKLDFKATEEELKAPTYMEWTDDRIAKLVREMAVKLRNRKVDGWEGVASMAASMVLINLCADANIGTFTQELSDVTNSDGDLGNWKIVIKKIEKKNHK